MKCLDPKPDKTPTPSANETPTGTPEPIQTLQPKTEQTLKLQYEKQFKREVGSVLTQTITGAKTAVVFESSNPKAAKVDKSSGVITCVGVGKAVITAKAEESSQYKAARKSVTTVVIPKTAKIKFLKSGKAFKARIRAYKKADGKTYFGKYSPWKTIKKVR